jgi:hypothetical protein
MNKWIVALLSLLLLSSMAFGQSVEGYGFFTPGQYREAGQGHSTLHFGGGGRYITSSGVGLGAELGVVGPTEDFSGLDWGMFSANGYYQFNTSSEKAKPFVTGGYTRSFGHFMNLNWGNFGGGLTYWFAARVGFLAEYRHHITSITKSLSGAATLQLWEIRFGLAFK